MSEVLVRNYVNELRPADAAIRKKLDFGYSYSEREIEIFELRPQFSNPENLLRLPYAKIRKIKSKGIWKLYWKRGSGKWELYDPHPEDTSLERILDTIRKDAYGCFLG